MEFNLISKNRCWIKLFFLRIKIYAENHNQLSTFFSINSEFPTATTTTTFHLFSAFWFYVYINWNKNWNRKIFWAVHCAVRERWGFMRREQCKIAAVIENIQIRFFPIFAYFKSDSPMSTTTTNFAIASCCIWRVRET